MEARSWSDTGKVDESRSAGDLQMLEKART